MRDLAMEKVKASAGVKFNVTGLSALQQMMVV